MNSLGHNADILYQLQLRRKELIHLCVRWQAMIRDIPVEGLRVASWGPSEEDLQDVDEDHAKDTWRWGEDINDNSRDEDDSEDDGLSDVEDDGDGDLLEEAESVALTDLYHAWQE